MRSIAHPFAASGARAGSWPVRGLVAAVTIYFCATHVLLGVFLGLTTWWAGAAAGIAIAILAFALFAGRWSETEPAIGWRSLLSCWAVAGFLLVLSGEGRFFYANPDWQVRNALLGDMGRSTWPFVYHHNGQDWLLRAPLGMYFLPALAWEWAGERGASLAMLVQNTLLAGTLLAAGGAALPTRHARLIGLAVLIVFSGLDAVGALKGSPWPWDHIEFWMTGLQYSSTMTLLFWVPHHALAGWAGAVAYLLWRQGLAPARLLLTITPLVSLWSPLAMIGLLPFAAHAGLSLLTTRRLRPADVLIPALAVALAVPALVYLAADPAGAPFRFVAKPLQAWLPFLIIETAPFLFPLWSIALRGRDTGGRDTGGRDTESKAALGTLVTVTATLGILPFLHIGEAADLMMRASIPALAILAVLVAQEVARPESPWRKWLILALCVGAITPALEVIRALRHPAAPRVDCTMFEAWDLGPRLYGAAVYGKGTYLARVDEVPAAIRPDDPVRVAAYSGKRCWDAFWYSPASRSPQRVRPYPGHD